MKLHGRNKNRLIVTQFFSRFQELMVDLFYTRKRWKSLKQKSQNHENILNNDYELGAMQRSMKNEAVALEPYLFYPEL